MKATPLIPDGTRLYDTDMAERQFYRVTDGTVWVTSSVDDFDTAVPMRLRPVTAAERAAYEAGNPLDDGELMVFTTDAALVAYDGHLFAADYDFDGTRPAADVFPVATIRETGRFDTEPADNA